MCIIIAIPENKIVPDDHIIESNLYNPDGMGIMYTVNNEIIVFKTFNVNELLEHYHMIAGLYPTIIHFRMTSHGVTSFENIHPFKVHKNLWFCHNGIISNMPDDKIKSDTILFNEMILQKLQHNFLNNTAIVEMISDYIDWSKLAFLDTKGNITIINESKGLYDNGIWYSNDSYLPYIQPYKNTINTFYGECEYCGIKDNVSYNADTMMILCELCKNELIVNNPDDDNICTECGIVVYGDDEIKYGICSQCELKLESHGYHAYMQNKYMGKV